MATDLDNLTTPITRGLGMEIFEPVNAWSGASGHIYLQVNPIVGGVYQVGYDPATDINWLRIMRYGGGWSEWYDLAAVVSPSKQEQQQ